MRSLILSLATVACVAHNVTVADVAAPSVPFYYLNDGTALLVLCRPLVQRDGLGGPKERIMVCEYGNPSTGVMSKDKLIYPLPPKGV